jgi:TIR domain
MLFDVVDGSGPLSANKPPVRKQGSGCGRRRAVLWHIGLNPMGDSDAPEVTDEFQRSGVPLFFFSYAHAGQPSPLVVEFFNDLSVDVAELVGMPAGSDPGFMDQSMVGGATWGEELLNAVGTCQVFIALLSGPYVASSWCGKEWSAFSKRKVISRSGDDATFRTGMIPVIWTTPMPDENRLPLPVTRVQRFSPRELNGENIRGPYEANGVYGLLRQNLLEQYRWVVWRLAQSIAEFHFAYRVEPLVLREHDLGDIFRERQP